MYNMMQIYIIINYMGICREIKSLQSSQINFPTSDDLPKMELSPFDHITDFPQETVGDGCKSIFDPWRYGMIIVSDN